jgi:hypothetical protein
MKQRNILFCFLSVLTISINCGGNPKQARKQLETMGITYDQKKFTEKAGTGEAKTVKLFIEVGILINNRAFTEAHTEELFSY